MYLGYQNDKIKFYTQTPLDPVLYNLDKVEETHDEYVLDGDEYVKNDDNYKAKLAAKERERLDNLSMTPSDVERSLYKAKGMDFEDLKALICEKLPEIDTKALAIEFRAKDFYRGAVVQIIKKDDNGNTNITNIRLFDTIGEMLGYNTDDMDYLFENKELPTVKIKSIQENDVK